MKLWIRLYTEVVEDPKVQRLPDPLFRMWINCLCLAGRNNGQLPAIADIAWISRKPEAAVKKMVDQLASAGLIDRSEDTFSPHAWSVRQYESDSSTERVKAFRKRSMKHPGNVSDSVPDPLPVTGALCSVSESVSEERKTSTAREPDDGPDRVNTVAKWIQQFGGEMGVSLNPDAGACMRITSTMLRHGKDLDDLQEIFRDLYEARSKPKNIGWLISVLEAKLGGGVNYAAQ